MTGKMLVIPAIKIQFALDFGFIDGHGNGEVNYLTYWQDKITPKTVILETPDPFTYIHLDQVIFYIKGIWPSSNVIIVTNGKIENEHETFLRAIVEHNVKIHVQTDCNEGSVVNRNIKRYLNSEATLCDSIDNIQALLTITPNVNNDEAYKQLMVDINAEPYYVVNGRVECMEQYINTDGRVSIPHLEIDIVKACNLKCKHCTHLSPYRHGYVTESDVVHWMETWAKKIVPRKALHLLGGEPLLHPDLPIIIHETRRIWGQGVPIAVVTNGTLLDQVSLDVFSAIKTTSCLLIISNHSETEYEQEQLNDNISLVKECGLNYQVRSSNQAWQVQYRLNKGHNPRPFNSLPRAAWTSCNSKLCCSLMDNNLYKCSVLQSVCEGVKEGDHCAKTWKQAVSYKPLYPDSTVQDILEHLRQDVIKECSICPDKYIIIEPSQICQPKTNKNNKIRVLLLVEHLLGIAGGAERVLCDMANALVDRNYDVFVRHLDTIQSEPYYHISDKVNIGGLNKIKEHKLLESSKYRHILHSSISKIEPDIIITHHLSHFSKIIDLFGHHLPIILMHHFHPQTWLLDRPDKELRSLNFCDCVQVLLPSFEEYLKKRVPHVKTKVIPNVVHPTNYVVNPGIKKETNFITMIGRLCDRHKQQHYLIRSFAKLARQYPDWQVRLYGEEY